MDTFWYWHTLLSPYINLLFAIWIVFNLWWLNGKRALHAKKINRLEGQVIRIQTFLSKPKEERKLFGDKDDG